MEGKSICMHVCLCMQMCMCMCMWMHVYIYGWSIQGWPEACLGLDGFCLARFHFWTWRCFHVYNNE